MRKPSGLSLALVGLLLVLAPGASAATITVTTNSDTTASNGFCSLREAITNANNDTAQFAAAGECAAGSGVDTIGFSAGFDGDADATNRITLGADSALPELIQPVRISGGDCDPSPTAAKPCVQLDANGGADGSGENGFSVTAADVRISGIAITDADDLPTAGIIGGDTASELVVRNVWFGIKLDGTPEPNGTGLLVQGDNATIGGTSPSDRNLFAASELTALNIFGAQNTTVQGNYFGTLADGATTAGLGNFTTIQVLGSAFAGISTGTLIGGPEAGAPGTCEAPCNVIATPNAAINLGSLGAGTLDAGQTRIEGNFLGLSATGTVLPGVGTITVGAADDVTIGGDASRRNYLQEVKAKQGATNLDIVSNFFGLNPAGTARISEGLIELGEGSPTVSPVDGATITANRMAATTGGVSPMLLTVTNSVVQGNTIGIGTGGQNVGGGNAGIALPGGGSGNQIGGTGPGEGNVIGNGSIGIIVGDTNTTVVGNRIGTDVTEVQSHPMTVGGIRVTGTSNVIGGATAASENVIVNILAGPSNGDAIHMSDNGADFNRILRNRGSVTAGQEFVDLGIEGPGNGTGTNEGIERPTITVGATSLQVSGTGALPGATVRVYRTASSAGATGPRDVIAYAGQATADGSGNWTLNCPSAGCEVGLPGAGQVTANQTSTTGNSSEMADPKAYTDLPPDTTITSGPANGGVTNDSTPTFGFASSEPSSTFECKVDGGAFGACTAPAGSHTTAVLSEGSHTFQVRATDNTANLDVTPASRTFTVDLTPPDTQVDSGPAAGATIADSTPDFGFSATEVGSSFQCRVDSDAFAACSGPGAAHTTAALGDGQHTFEVRGTDPAGNTDASPAGRTFTVDATPPDTQINSGPATGSTTVDSTPSFDFSATEAGSAFECRLDGEAFAVCSSEHTTAALGNGQHTFEVRATDPVGNVDPSPATRTFTVDADPPETRIDRQPKDKLKVKKTATVTYEFSSDEPGSTFRCKIDGKPEAPCSSPLKLKKLKKGKHSFEVTAVDAAGNADPTPATDTFKVKRKRRRR